MKETKTVNTRKLQGVVLSNKMAKTVVVAVDTKRAHPLYKKIVTSRKKYKVHTNESLEIGDTVSFQECSPISKEKRWIVVEKVS